MSLLEIKDLTVQFGGLTALSQLSMTVDKGSIHGLIGPNGAGKSTVFNCISSYYTPASGEILISGINLLGKKQNEIINHGIARTFQNLELFQNLSVLDNVLIGYHTRLKNSFFSAGLNLLKTRRSEQEAKDKAMTIISYLGIENERDSLVYNLPYGIQKKVEIARALVSEPELVLLDEPAAGLNSSETAQLMELFREIRSKFGTTMLLVEHDMSMVMELCDRITVIEFGKEIASGTPKEIKQNPKVIAAYLGEENLDAIT